MALFVVKDLLTNLQNFQANGLIAALMILTYVLWRKDWLAGAALCPAPAPTRQEPPDRPADEHRRGQDPALQALEGAQARPPVDSGRARARRFCFGL